MAKVLTVFEAEALLNPAKAKARTKLGRLYRRWWRAERAAEPFLFIDSVRATLLWIHTIKCEDAYQRALLNFEGDFDDTLYPPTSPGS